jgi:hopanoid biosynthesis associated RND transporter like protein HpnN
LISSFIARLVDFSHRFALVLILFALLISSGLAWYVSEHFKMNTDINQLMSADLDWRVREMQVQKGFPQKSDVLVVVVDGDTPDAAEAAAEALTLKLQAMPKQFSQVYRPDRIPFFVKNGLLLLSKDEISSILDQMIQAQPILGVLANDPSLRGFFGMIDMMLDGVARGETDFKQLDAPLNLIAETMEANLAGQDKPLVWQSMGTDKKPTLRDVRKFIMAKPVLDYTALEPGAEASNALRAVVKDLHLNGVRVRLTGDVALNDEEFASVSEGTGFATILSGVLVLGILLWALRSWRIVVPILLTLIVGLITTTAFALVTIGSLNLISVAFAVMFIGIAVDFGIQFGVRYRDQHHQEPDHAKAMTRTARLIALPLTMAAGSTSLGFFAFIPTAYRGVSELGLIAGGGMLIAFFLNITLLPAFLAFTKPPAEPEAVGYKWAAPIDRFIEVHRKKILWLSLLIALIGGAIAVQIRFDFDPLNLKDPNTESVSTLFDAMQDPDFTTYTIDILRPSLKDAQELAAKLEKLPEVDHVMTLASFVPDEQDDKLAMIGDASMIFASTLNAAPLDKQTSDGEIIDALKKVLEKLRTVANQPASVTRLANAIDTVIQRNDTQLLQRLHHNLVSVMQNKLDLIKQTLSADTVTIASITDDLRRDWVTPDGQFLIQVYPKGNARDHKILIAFTGAVRQIAPDATGAPISIQESAKTISQAFIYAGLYALLTIAVLSFLILRRVLDVIFLMAPLLLAGILTLATIVLIELPLNFANVIALPLLLSLGVSYAIYFVSYARAGFKNPLQSSMARAVLFSAATALVAFGSLSLSSHTGTSGMGKLLLIALLYSLSCSFILLPALLASPVRDKQ